ncbi:MAG: TrmB family transcriptional regulator [Ktedonobacteraceae bacterium]
MMTVIELLQQIGLNKYEAEAYYTLLAEGPLTGYELGKRSQVPLSRSYEILERLTQKGLALVQPADPPHYLAASPDQFLGQVRATMLERLDTLASVLATLPQPDSASEFWVVRGRQQVLNRVRTMIASAQRAVDLSLSPEDEAEVREVLALSRARGCHIFQPPTIRNNPASGVILLVDGREALVGTLAPVNHCQAVVSANQALVSALRAYFASRSQADVRTPVTSTVADQQDNQLDWLAWEERKQRRLWSPNIRDQVA